MSSATPVKAGTVCPPVADDAVGPRVVSVATQRSKQTQHHHKVIFKMMNVIQDFAQKANEVISIGLEELFYRYKDYYRSIKAILAQ